MADVFLSCVSNDYQRAQRVAAALTLSGLEVSWDPTVAERSPGYDVEGDLTSAKCVVVLWSFSSVASGWVRSVAMEASQRRILAAALLDDVRLPLGFRTTVAANLAAWSGTADDSAFQALLKAVRRIESSTPARARSNRSHMLSAVLRPAEGVPGPAQTDSPSASAGTPPEQPVRSTDRDKDTARIVFLCYRREDADDAAGRLYDRLVDAYGTGRVFIDIDSVPLGADFIDHISEQISRCSAVIVLIGRHWLTIKDKRRRRRLSNDDDLVRAEIRAALQQKIGVIPVVVQNASMPNAEDLPEDIRLLARRNGIQLRSEHWKDGVERLLKELDKVMRA